MGYQAPPAYIKPPHVGGCHPSKFNDFPWGTSGAIENK